MTELKVLRAWSMEVNLSVEKFVSEVSVSAVKRGQLALEKFVYVGLDEVGRDLR